MNAGNVEQFGTPEEVYHQPASTFVASFIGSPPMNSAEERPRQPGRAHPGHTPRTSSTWRPAAAGSSRSRPSELLGAERLLYGKVGGEE